jgi:hypothetical protein
MVKDDCKQASFNTRCHESYLSDSISPMLNQQSHRVSRLAVFMVRILVTETVPTVIAEVVIENLSIDEFAEVRPRKTAEHR